MLWCAFPSMFSSCSKCEIEQKMEEIKKRNGMEGKAKGKKRKGGSKEEEGREKSHHRELGVANGQNQFGRSVCHAFMSCMATVRQRQKKRERKGQCNTKERDRTSTKREVV